MDASTAAERQYVWGDRYVDDLVLRDRDTDANGSLDERLYALQDPNWNVAAIANSTGDVQERYTYSAYGAPTVLTDVFGSRGSTSFAWDQLYTGRQRDVETGLYYYRNRYYSADLGRFVTRDPIGYEAGDFNVYRYVRNRPLSATDPSGLGVPLKTCLNKCKRAYGTNTKYLAACTALCTFLQHKCDPANACIGICRGMGPTLASKRCAEICLIIFPN